MDRVVGYVAVMVGDGGIMNRRDKIISVLRYQLESPHFFWVIGSILVIIGTLVFFMHFIHLPISQRQIEVNEEIRRTEQSILVTENFLREHHNESLPKYTEKLKQRHERSLAALPTKPELGKFLTFLHKNAKKNDITITMLKSASPYKEKYSDGDGTAAQTDKPQELPMDISFTADYFSLLDFLNDLNDSERFMKISELTVKSDGRKLDCTLKITVFTFAADVSDVVP